MHIGLSHYNRMDSHGIPDMIQVSTEFRELLKDKYKFEERGEVDIKGKNKHKTYLLLKTNNPGPEITG